MLTYHRLKSEKEALYDYEPWSITEDEFNIENNHHNEAIFSLGNGYMGLRGIFEEDYLGPQDQSTPGFYINGIYETEDIIYGEFMAKQPQKYQTMINLMDWTTVNLYIDNEKFSLFKGNILDYKRRLDIKNGLINRTLIWQTESFKKVKIDIERIISFKYKHIGAIKYEVTPLNFSGKIEIKSSLKGDVRNHHHLQNNKVLSIKQKGSTQNYYYMMMLTNNSKIYIGSSCFNKLSGENEGEFLCKENIDEKNIDQIYTIRAEEDTTYTLKKYASFYTSRDINKNEILNSCFEDLSFIDKKNTGFKHLKKTQKDFLKNYWRYSDIKIEGDPSLQQAFRYNALQILQSTGREGRTNISAKGLTGEFYEGHYFWDTETYIIPFFLYSQPEIAKQLLNFRYKTLDSARENAKRMNLKGALYPWRTINGKEASGNFLGSTVQYHIDADIVFACYNYVNATDDKDFLYNKGAEIIFETARMWLSLGHFEKLKDDSFCINEVCGPDEYKPAVNNNCYTNYMAKFNLEYAVEVYQKIKENNLSLLKKIKNKIDLSDQEIKKWKKAAAQMYLPFNKKLKINPQDDSFIYKEEINIEEIPIKELPLVKNWHPLTIWKYQLIKQADVILLMLFMGDQFSLEQKKRNYDYYEPKTTHDSSLSPSIYSVIASEIGYYEDAYDYFLQTARLDLDDYNENAYQGLHTACMGSNWMVLVQGFAGMRIYEDKLNFNPYLPVKWNGYQFKIKYKNTLLKVHIKQDYTEYTLLEGETISFIHKNKEIILTDENNKSKVKQEIFA